MAWIQWNGMVDLNAEMDWNGGLERNVYTAYTQYVYPQALCYMCVHIMYIHVCMYYTVCSRNHEDSCFPAKKSTENQSHNSFMTIG